MWGGQYCFLQVKISTYKNCKKKYIFAALKNSTYKSIISIGKIWQTDKKITSHLFQVIVHLRFGTNSPNIRANNRSGKYVYLKIRKHLSSHEKILGENVQC